MALVIVMGALVLISFLVLTILTLNLGEQRAATHSAELTDVRTLAELPGQLVISQIRNATQGLGQGLTWTSQPGLIRVFDTSVPPTATDEASLPPPRKQLIYPLYSSVTLYADEKFDLKNEISALGNWAGSPALFVDLNDPIELRRDPLTGGTLSMNQLGTLLYPIVDPSAFEVATGATTSRILGMRELSPGPGKSNRQPVPMPVRWLYVLSNGKVLAPLPSSTPTIARFNQRDLEPANNEPPPRIMGRIAFWADDESCKINLNTASEPAPWLAPMTVSDRDLSYADSSPLRGEYHRLPGHPAFTALSPVMRGFGAAFVSPQLQPVPQPARLNEASSQAYSDFIDTIHSLLPGLPARDTGSVHGTMAVLTNTQPPEPRLRALFPAVDDLLFDSGQIYGPRTIRLRNGHRNVAAYSMDESDIRRARFCLTTHSSAPETNPFNQPKISLWPVQADRSQHTRTDQLMTLASSIGGQSDSRFLYATQRAVAWSGPATPGSSQSTSQDAASGSRNEQLFDWIRGLTNKAFPGYGASFEEKYGRANCDQLVLNMFDMMRWLSNPGNEWLDHGATYRYLAKSPNPATGVEGAGMVSPLIKAATSGSSSPYRGVGRVPTITEAAIVFIATNAKRDGNNQIEVDDDPTGRFTGFAKQTTEARAFIVLEPFNTSPGHPSMTPSIKYVLKGLNGPDAGGADPPPTDFPYTMVPHTLNGTPLFFGRTSNLDTLADLYELPNHVTFSPSFSPINASGTQVRRFGGDSLAYTGLTAQFVKNDALPRELLARTDPDKNFAWFSQSMTLPPPNDNGLMLPVAYTGGDVLLEIRHATTDEILQEIVLPFGTLSGMIPVPRLHPDDFPFVANAPNDSVLLRRFALKPNPADPDAPPYLPLIRRGDVVRSVELKAHSDDPHLEPSHGGDVRVIANRYRVLGDWYAPCIDPPPLPNVYESHSLREGVYDQPGLGQIGSSTTDLFTDTPRHPLTSSGYLLTSSATLDSPLDSVGPAVRQALVHADPTSPSASGLRFGDWETGPGNLPDGPFFARQDHLNAPSQSAIHGWSSNAASTFTDGGQLTDDVAGLSHLPQRQISSAIVFGSLSPTLFGRGPTGDPTQPEGWRTLLFCPNPASRTTPANVVPTELDHPGFGTPPDSLWLDFFWVPTVEPRFLSPAFATEGKINLNFQMIPFTWLERSSGIHAALQGVRIPAIPHNAAPLYKQPLIAGRTAAVVPEFQYEVDTEETLRAMRGVFARGEVFTHPSDVCSLYLMPKRIEGAETEYDRGLSPSPIDPEGLSLDQINEWWNGADPNQPLAVDAFELTGDNLRESPYGQLYPRLCTRSNVFKVHYRVQLLGKSRSTAANEWNIERERIQAEQRGAVTVERFLDPNDPTIPDFATKTPNGLALDEFYRYRILSREPFTP